MHGASGVSPDHVAKMQLRQFIVGQLERLEIVALQLFYQLPRFMPTLDLDPHEHMRALRVGIAVVEFRDVATSDALTESQETPRAFRNRHRQERLALLAKFRALGNEPQAIEVDVRSGRDSHQRLT